MHDSVPIRNATCRRQQPRRNKIASRHFAESCSHDRRKARFDRCGRAPDRPCQRFAFAGDCGAGRLQSARRLRVGQRRWFAQFCSCARPVKSEACRGIRSLLEDALQEIVPLLRLGQCCKFAAASRTWPIGIPAKVLAFAGPRAVTGGCARGIARRLFHVWRLGTNLCKSTTTSRRQQVAAHTHH